MNFKEMPIPEHRKEIYAFYGLAFDENGFPMKNIENGLTFHPILPPYLITDYILMFEKTGDEMWLQYAEHIADSVIGRADVLKNSKVFFYHPESGLSSVPKVFYSALTQSWYLKAFCLLSKYWSSKYNQFIKEIFNSFLIPIEEGGVLIVKKYGWIVEEYPFEPAFYTLNGWLTVLRWIVQSRKILDDIGIEYEQFINKNLDAVEKLLPLYDAKFCLNSRYQLTGFSRIKVVFNKPILHACVGASIEIPGEGVFECCIDGKKNKEKSRWEYYLERNEGRILQFNVVLSLISSPKPNVFNFIVDVDKDCSAKIFIAQGKYRPDSTGMPTESWKEISEHNLSKGRNKIQSETPFDGTDMFAYPTNFKKHIDGINYNGYHFVHIVDLGEIYQYSNRNIFKEYANKWLKYYENWEELDCLKEGYSLTHYLYGNEFSDYVNKNFLNKSP